MPYFYFFKPVFFRIPHFILFTAWNEDHCNGLSINSSCPSRNCSLVYMVFQICIPKLLFRAFPRLCQGLCQTPSKCSGGVGLSLLALPPQIRRGRQELKHACLANASQTGLPDWSGGPFNPCPSELVQAGLTRLPGSRWQSKEVPERSRRGIPNCSCSTSLQLQSIQITEYNVVATFVINAYRRILWQVKK